MIRHTHDHGTLAPANERRLTLALAISASLMAVEVAAGLWSGSLALLSDAAHMLTDVSALTIALFAVHAGRRPPDEQHTFGHRRYEILAAAVNAALLFVIAAFILIEAIHRLREPREIKGAAMLAVAVAGLIGNALSARLLHGGRSQSLNLRGAYLEALSDLIASIGVILAAGIILLTGRRWVDPVVAIAIALWVLPRGWLLLRDCADILMDAVPKGYDVDKVARALAAVPGVVEVHDLHLWSITSGKPSLTAHLTVDDARRSPPAVLGDAQRMLQERFQIGHSTLQIESRAYPATDCATEGHEKRH